MAAAMLAGPVSVPAVFNTSAIVRVAVVAEKQYASNDIRRSIEWSMQLMNIPYADFLQGRIK